MRNFEERKAEIFRRSENRIKERKRNCNRILTVCIPLCLILTVCAVSFLPEMRTKGMNYAPREDLLLPEYAGKNTACSVKIELICADSEYRPLLQQPFVSTEDAERFYYSMESSLVTDRGEQHKEQDKLTDSSENINEEEFTLGGAGNPLPGYKITITMNDGTEETYTLNGYTLTKGTADNSIILTEAQRGQLVKMLESMIKTKEGIE